MKCFSTFYRKSIYTLAINVKLLFLNKYQNLFENIDHYENPRIVGSLNKNKKTVGTLLVGASLMVM